jgi:hypothetical protein
MKNQLRTLEDYELFLYTLVDNFSSIRYSTLTSIRKGASLARIEGEIHFEQKFRLVIRERILYNRLPVIIDWYGYEVWQGENKLFWYDPQPHPNESSLKSTYSHHKHIPPDIKHNRITASEMSFTRQNITHLIREIEEQFKSKI